MNQTQQTLNSLDEAIELQQRLFERFELESEGDYVSNLNLQGWILATSVDDGIRDGQKAAESAQTACELTAFADSSLLNTLAAAFAETRDFDAAIRWQQEAIDISSEDDLETYQAHLKAFENQQPIREGS